MNPIKQIAEYGIPTNTYGSAIIHLNDREDLSRTQYEKRIKELTGVVQEYTDDRDAKYCFLYLIQETIRKSYNTDKFNMPELLEYSTTRARNFVRDNPWHWAVAEEEVQIDSFGKPKRKKGAKQIEALRIYKENVDEGKPAIIDMFMSELDMSKSGATTYFYNMKKKVENE